MFDAQIWAAVPPHFWTAVFFALGAIFGSLLNVCIHRMPRDESIVRPPSHCPSCQYQIPWHHNIPLLTWLWLRGRCANCAAPISVRYFLVELLTAVAFASLWITHGARSPLVAVAYCVLIAGLIVATFIDIEHFIIPDEITLGGVAVGFLASGLIPDLHNAVSASGGLKQSFWGVAAGGGIIYGILRLGKLLFGRQHFDLDPGTKVIFTETSLVLPDHEIPYDEVFYRKSDAIVFEASRIEMIDRCYNKAEVRLTPSELRIGEEKFNPETVLHMEVVTNRLVLPREAMGLGDVKFMAAIGAFLGWQAVLFSLVVSAMLGAAVGITGIALGRQAWSSRIPYGPYIAVAATVWMFTGDRLVRWWFGAGLTGP